MADAFPAPGPGQLLEEPQNSFASSGDVGGDLDVCEEHSGFLPLVSSASYSSS